MTVKYIDKGIERLLRYAEKAAAMKGMTVSIDANYAACYSFTVSGATASDVTTLTISVPDYDSLAMDFTVTDNDDGQVLLAMSDYEYPITVADWSDDLGAIVYACADQTTAEEYLPEEYASYAAYLKGFHVSTFVGLILDGVDTSSADFDQFNTYMKDFPVAETGEASTGAMNKVAALLSKMGVGVAKWKDLQELTCPTA